MNPRALFPPLLASLMAMPLALVPIAPAMAQPAASPAVKKKPVTATATRWMPRMTTRR